MAKYIAEISSNHCRDLNRSIEFIDVAAAIGCDAVKFQLFKITRLFSNEALAFNPDLMKRCEWELPVDFLPVLADRALEKGIEFSCTPFYIEAVAELLPFVDFYKIASYELLWDELLIACAKTGKPLVLSTGMATTDEISHAVSVVKGAGCDNLSLLHCVSSYPAPATEYNLGAISALRELSGCAVGLSDHSVSPEVVLRAVHRWDAEIIEFHLDLDGSGEEFRTGHCWLPDQINDVITKTKLMASLDGDGIKRPSSAELTEREWRADPSDGLRPLMHTRSKLTRI